MANAVLRQKQNNCWNIFGWSFCFHFVCNNTQATTPFTPILAIFISICSITSILSIYFFICLFIYLYRSGVREISRKHTERSEILCPLFAFLYPLPPFSFLDRQWTAKWNSHCANAIHALDLCHKGFQRKLSLTNAYRDRSCSIFQCPTNKFSLFIHLFVHSRLNWRWRFKFVEISIIENDYTNEWRLNAVDRCVFCAVLIRV